MTRRTGRYGKKANRSAMRSMPRSTSPHSINPPREKKPSEDKLKSYFHKKLIELQITTTNFLAIQVFQEGWNEVVRSGRIQGQMLEENNSPDIPTQKALKIARDFQASKPKSWIYYVKKSILTNG